jgi:hypothetical protein
MDRRGDRGTRASQVSVLRLFGWSDLVGGFEKTGVSLRRFGEGRLSMTALWVNEV